MTFFRSHRAKRLNITVKPFVGVRVSVPYSVSLKKAKEALVESRLILGKTSYQQNQDLVPYTVLDQSIAPGTVLDQSTHIDLIVSILDLQDIFDKINVEK